MNEDKLSEQSKNLLACVQEAIDKAFERHRKLGESIAVWQDGKVVILEAHEIPIPSEDREVNKPTIIHAPQPSKIWEELSYATC